MLSQSSGGVTVLYPGDFFGLDEATQPRFHSPLGKPTFYFHIHDSDLWMYTLYHEGEVADQFNPIPGYWEEVDEATGAAWAGNAVAVAKRVLGLEPAQIERYLVTWNLGLRRAADSTKAYETDKHCYGDECQLLDFMLKLGPKACPHRRGQLPCGPARRSLIVSGLGRWIEIPRGSRF